MMISTTQFRSAIAVCCVLACAINLCMLLFSAWAVHDSPSSSLSVGVVGAGWYGLQIAEALALEGYDVVVLEKHDSIFPAHEMSHSFGLRVHSGGHYPRSRATRESCQKDLAMAKPKMDNVRQWTFNQSGNLYCLATEDQHGRPSKVSLQEFEDVMEELGGELIDKTTEGFNTSTTQGCWRVPEMFTVKSALRPFMMEKLKKANVGIRTGILVESVSPAPNGGGLVRFSKAGSTTVFEKHFDHVVLATAMHLRPEDAPQLDFEFRWQVALGLQYRSSAPFNPWIMMDGEYPCFMPLTEKQDKWYLTHGRHTLPRSFDAADLDGAKAYLASLGPATVNQVKQRVMADVTRFRPDLIDKLTYEQFHAAVIPKLVVDSDLRRAFAFKHPRASIIEIFPGKIPAQYLMDEVVDLVKASCAYGVRAGSRGCETYQYSRLMNSSFLQEYQETPSDPSHSTIFLYDGKSE